MSSETAQPGPPTCTWETVVQPAATLEKLKRAAEAWKNWQTLDKNSPLAWGVLLHGAAGTGKTYCARTLVNESGCALLSIGRENLVGYIGQAENKVRSVFERAHSHAPCILLFDAIDYITPSRSSRDADMFTHEIIVQILTQWEAQRARGGVFVLGTAFEADKVDPSIVARVESIAIPCPGIEERRRLFGILLAAPGVATDFDVDTIAQELADKTKQISHRGADYLVRKAMERAGTRAQQSGEERPVLTRNDLMAEIESGTIFNCFDKKALS